MEGRWKKEKRKGRGGKLKVSRPLTEGKNSHSRRGGAGGGEEGAEGYLRNEMNSAGVSITSVRH